MGLATNYDICATLQALQSYLLSIVGQYLKKLALLQRLASIMEQAGDLLQIPNLTNLIPVGLIDATNYNQIRCACPFLNLPDLTSEEAALADFQSLVAKGYQALDSYLASHPYAAMNALQDQLDQLLAQIESTALNAISPGLDVIGCLEAICNGLDQLQLYASNYVTSATSDFDELTNPNNVSNVLNEAQQAKAYLISNGRATLQALGNFTPPPLPAALGGTGSSSSTPASSGSATSSASVF